MRIVKFVGVIVSITFAAQLMLECLVRRRQMINLSMYSFPAIAEISLEHVQFPRHC